ncbi:MAG: hypothetical protein QG635_1108 [Bacteroidota bacterium]|nr:hypothetical protein [Bacteroidota bacterium]
MAEKIKVQIGIREYTLVGEDIGILQKAAEEVNEQIRELKKRHSDENSTTITVLAALNIAEKQIRNQNQYERDKVFILEEVSTMTQSLSNDLSKF